MQRRLSKKNWFNSLALSLLLHLLFFAAFLSVIFFHPLRIKPPHDYVPAYTYANNHAPAVQQQAAVASAANTSSSVSSASSHIKTTQSSKSSLKKISSQRRAFSTESILASSLRILQENQMQQLENKKNVEPIYMVGDKNEVADPLIQLLGKALSAHFSYPKAAGEFGIRGRVLVGMTLHPQGFLSDIKMLKSSDNEDLDAAALRAVNTAPTIMGAARFLSQPKYFVVGFIFN